MAQVRKGATSCPLWLTALGPPSTAEDSTKDEVQRRQRELEELCAPFAQQLGLVRRALAPCAKGGEAMADDRTAGRHAHRDPHGHGGCQLSQLHSLARSARARCC